MHCDGWGKSLCHEKDVLLERGFIMMYTEFIVFLCSRLYKNVTAEIHIHRDFSGNIDVISMIGCSDEMDCSVMIETGSDSYVHDWASCPIHNHFQENNQNEREMKKLLIIDDEKDFVYFLKYNLQSTNPEFRVDTASNGKTGIEKAIREKPDLILLDILMPKMNGYEVLKKLKENDKTRGIPVVMLTGRIDEESMTKAADLFCDDYITKPGSSDIIRSKIDAVLSRIG
ncbi:PleD family two-component system response regulator [Thermodesulfobacteriota bacterium]